MAGLDRGAPRTCSSRPRRTGSFPPTVLAEWGIPRGMDRFVSNFTLRLDAKGRVSIPAPYRAVLARDGFDGLYCYPALDQPAVDAGGNALLAKIEALIESFPPYSDQRDAFTLSLYGTSETLKIDGEGRVILTDALKTHAGITE